MFEQFRGKKDVKIDGKGRIAFPASFRRVLEANHPARAEGENAVLYVGSYEKEPFLTCWSQRVMDDLTARIDEMDEGDPDREALEEYVFENVEEIMLDDNGRFVLPKRLRDFIGLDDVAIFGGRGDRFRITSPAVPREAVSKLAERMALKPQGSSPLSLLPSKRKKETA